MKKRSKISKKRYYLHERLKGIFPIDPLARTIDVPYKEFKQIPVPERYYVGQLIALGYQVQLKLL